jgi:hypothetical protein
MVALPDFHDGFVDGILVRGSSAHVLLRTVTEQRHTLQLNEVNTLRANNFRQGNIILEVNLLSVSQLDHSFVFQAYDHNDHSKQEFVLEDWKRNAIEKRFVAIAITASYGCELLAVFRSHNLIEGHITPP